MSSNRRKRCKKTAYAKDKTTALSIKELAVIAAILTKALKVESILIDSDQTVQIILEGSLRKKTRMDMIIDEVSEATVGELLDSLLKR